MKRESIYKSAAVIVFTSFASYLLIYKLIPALQKISSKESEKNFLKNEYQLKYSNTQFNLNLVNTDNSYVNVAKQFLFPFSKCFSENFVSKLKPQSSHSVIHIEFLLAQYLKDLFFGLINKEKSKINLFSGKRTLTEKEFVQIFQSNQFIRSFTMFLVSKSNKIIYFPFLMINCLNHKVTVSILDFIEKEKILTKNTEKEHGIIHLPEVLVVFLEDFVDSKNFDLENETVFCLYNMKYVLVSFCVYLNQDYYLYQRNNKKWYEFSHQMIEVDINLFKQGRLIFVTYEKYWNKMC